ncbi:hypothetical protein [Piscinibacter sp. XHJ-5]|uniref:hypothetical protein n=1 Tax=Piscinibacter sp. XHJ-5 TaxID=3037797 RepID=UPI00245292C5|nr:hypothetical protein [Piscinibacter sp. XHJ-5]
MTTPLPAHIAALATTVAFGMSLPAQAEDIDGSHAASPPLSPILTARAQADSKPDQPRAQLANGLRSNGPTLNGLPTNGIMTNGLRANALMAKGSRADGSKGTETPPLLQREAAPAPTFGVEAVLLRDGRFVITR